MAFMAAENHTDAPRAVPKVKYRNAHAGAQLLCMVRASVPDKTKSTAVYALSKNPSKYSSAQWTSPGAARVLLSSFSTTSRCVRVALCQFLARDRWQTFSKNGSESKTTPAHITITMEAALKYQLGAPESNKSREITG